jgi:hypothetical protein
VYLHLQFVRSISSLLDYRGGYHITTITTSTTYLSLNTNTLHFCDLGCLLIRAVGLLGARALLELHAVLGDRDLERYPCVLPAMVGGTELLGRLELAKADGDDAIGFHVEERDVGEVAVLLGLLGHVLLDLKVRFGVFIQLFERESMFDNANLLPLVLLRREDLLDLFFIIRPFSKLAIQQLDLMITSIAKNLPV